MEGISDLMTFEISESAPWGHVALPPLAGGELCPASAEDGSGWVDGREIWDSTELVPPGVTE